MSAGPPDRDDIRDRVLVDTPVLDTLEQSSLPFRGKRRKQIVRRVRAAVRSRRTTGALAGRVANVTIGTLSDAVEEEGRVAVEENVQRLIEQRLESERAPVVQMISSDD